MLNKQISLIARQKTGQYLKDARIKVGLTRYAVAKSTGLTQGQIKIIEDGSKNYTVDALFAYVLAVDLEKIGRIFTNMATGSGITFENVAANVTTIDGLHGHDL